MSAWRDDPPRCETCGLAVGEDYDGSDTHECPPAFLTPVNDRRSPSPGRRATDPSPDIIALERAAESLTRHGDLVNAVALWSIALRLRMEGKCPVT